jgi:hypothetical protein
MNILVWDADSGLEFGDDLIANVTGKINIMIVHFS